MELYTVKFDSGYMTIIKAETFDQAEYKAKKEAKEQCWDVISIKLTTEDDLIWVRGMGGRVPE